MKITKLIIAIAVVLMLGSNADALLIDDFSSTQGLALPGPGSISSSAGGGIGGERDMKLTVGSGSGGSLTSNIPPLSFNLKFSLDTETTGVAEIVWDGGDSSPAIDYTGLGGVDLTEGSVNDRISLRVLFDDDLYSSPITLKVYTSATAWSYYTFARSPHALPLTLNALFSSFTMGGSSTADFTDVGAIALTIIGGPSADMTMDFIESTNENPVPEPATLLLVGVGLLGIGILRSRKFL